MDQKFCSCAFDIAFSFNICLWFPNKYSWSQWGSIPHISFKYWFDDGLYIMQLWGWWNAPTYHKKVLLLLLLCCCCCQLEPRQSIELRQSIEAQDEQSGIGGKVVINFNCYTGTGDHPSSIPTHGNSLGKWINLAQVSP